MPTAPDPVMPTGLPSAPAAPTNTAGAGTVSAPSAPANAAGSGTVSAPGAPVAMIAPEISPLPGDSAIVAMGKRKLVLSGITSPAWANGTLFPVAASNGYAAWSSDGRNVGGSHPAAYVFLRKDSAGYWCVQSDDGIALDARCNHTPINQQAMPYAYPGESYQNLLLQIYAGRGSGIPLVRLHPEAPVKVQP